MTPAGPQAAGSAAGQHPGRVRPHLPIRPLWFCRTCAGPWPCATARLTLITEYAGARAALCIYLSGLLHEATADLHTLNPHDAPEPPVLFERFLGWASPRR